MPKLSKLYDALAYVFSDVSLLALALTHRSFSIEHNERLEFLGDSVLNFLIAEYLFSVYTQLPEGALTRLRANLVNTQSLMLLAKKMHIAPYLKLGKSAIKNSHGSCPDSILANVMEAILGAIFLDGGMESCRKCLKIWYADLFCAIAKEGVKKDHKTQLQEYAQSRKMCLPVYTIQNITGKAHQQIFHVICSVSDLNQTATAVGKSRKCAEQAAAQKLLDALK